MTEDYSAFSQEAIEKSIQDMLKNVKKQTGASDDEIALAFYLSASRIMDVNCFELEGGE